MDLEGLYVLGRSNAEGKEIPHLPIIELDSTGDVDGWYKVKGFGASAADTSLFCNGLKETFSEGDVIWISPRHGEIRGILTAGSNSNTLLLTERCENRCEFCSQPPNELEDKELYHKAALALLNFDTCEYVGLSGGEPTHNKRAFLSLLKSIRQFESNTKLHILSNGRKLGDEKFAKEVVSNIGEREVLWGIPLYGHKASLHDDLVGSSGAFIDTLDGLSNLSNLGQVVELRIVPVRRNIKTIANILEFITSNYLSIKTISIMNMEPKGLARKNYSNTHVPVEEQVEYIERAVRVGERYGCSVRLFNYPLCLLSEYLRHRAVKSISDWKNYYPGECSGCEMQTDCGGMFASAVGRFQEQVRRIG
ncbi:MAG: His-Xaa-Ser system radical SAM maturase HxsC [gamma proteobacterium symbiont of Clathrolucina costata]